MKARLLAAGLLLVATGAVAQDAPDTAALDMTLAKVKPARVYFYSGDERPGCPALIAACRRPAYVRAGDLMLVSTRQGDWVQATYASDTRETTGWLPRAALEPQATPVQPLSGWVGSWSRDEADITVKPGKRPGELSFTGEALYGTHDPARVRNGAINMGEIDETGSPRDGRVMLVSAGQDDCRVAIRLIGPYLAVADNNNCGGLNVSFSGVYRRTAKAAR